jgi:hypothetical protein
MFSISVISTYGGHNNKTWFHLLALEHAAAVA